MKSLTGLLILALIGFYIAWPAYSGYRIKTALDTQNPDLLAAKIDFDSVRTSLIPAVTAEVHKQLAASMGTGGQNAELIAQVESQMLPKVLPTALAAIVTPETILRIYTDGRDYKTVLNEIIREKAKAAGSLDGILAGVTQGSGQGKGGLGDLLGAAGKALGVDTSKALGGAQPPPAQAPAPAPAQSETPADKPAAKSFSLSNVKSFSFTGLAGYSVGLAKDPSALSPDVNVDLAYKGGDWKLVGLRPKV